MAIGLVLLAGVIALPVAVCAWLLGFVSFGNAVLIYMLTGWAVVAAGFLSALFRIPRGRCRLRRQGRYPRRSDEGQTRESGLTAAVSDLRDDLSEGRGSDVEILRATSTTPRNCTPKLQPARKRKAPLQALVGLDFISCPEPLRRRKPLKREPGGEASGADTQRTAMMRSTGIAIALQMQKNIAARPMRFHSAISASSSTSSPTTVPVSMLSHARHWRRLLVLVLRDPDRAHCQNIGVAHRRSSDRENAQGLPAGPRRRGPDWPARALRLG